MLPLLLALLAPPQDLRLETVRESLTGVHCRYRVFVGDLPTDEVIVRRCTTGSSARSTQRVQTNSVSARERFVDGRRVRRTIVYEAPLEPWAEDVDAESGELVRRVPLFHRATRPARVFDPNPVASLNAPALQDRNDAATAVPATAYRDVQLLDVADSGPLRGPHVLLSDRQPPFITPPDAAGSLVFDRSADGFEDVQAYFHIDRNQRHLQSLGYTGRRAVVPYAIEVDAHALSGADNSYFLPSLVDVGTGILYFGEGGTDDAEEADILVHEYGHAILEWIAPGTFGGSFGSEARALGEGFGDYWAFSAHREARLASGRDPYCFADWDARCWENQPADGCTYAPGSDCLRRLDSRSTMRDYVRTDNAGVEHVNGAIWSSALREIHEELGRTVTDTLVIESIFDAPAQPRFADLATRMMRADELLFGGVHRETICRAMISREILATCEDTPRGELTLHQSIDRDLPLADVTTTTSTITITDPRAIERLLVRVDLEHESRGDLRIELVAPDGTVIVLQSVSIDRGTGLHVTYGLTATPVDSLDVLHGRSAAGTWQLRIIDQRAFDAGRLHSWALLLQLEGDVPSSVRPRDARTQMLPVVAHLNGIGGAPFRSDVRITNVASDPRIATLVFTRSGEDGTSAFSAIRVRIDRGHTVVFDDVVDSAFGLSGSGTLEILGDVVVMSRTYTTWSGGTVGQQVPPAGITTTDDAYPLFVASIADPETRVNLGVAEVSGRAGTVLIGERRFTIPPYSHLQVPVASGQYQIFASGAQVTAYLSQVHNRTGDAMFIPADTVRVTYAIAPVISAVGADRVWRSDVWFGRGGGGQAFPVAALQDGVRREVALATSSNPRTIHDVLRTLFDDTFTFAALRVRICCSFFAGTRVATDGISQYVPLLDPQGALEQSLLLVETADPYRTNVGFVSADGAIAEVSVYDAAGAEIERRVIATAGGAVQIPVTARVRNGHARVQFLSGTGRAYASLIDGRTGDATFVPGQ